MEFKREPRRSSKMNIPPDMMALIWSPLVWTSVLLFHYDCASIRSLRSTIMKEKKNGEFKTTSGWFIKSHHVNESLGINLLFRFNVLANRRLNLKVANTFMKAEQIEDWFWRIRLHEVMKASSIILFRFFFFQRKRKRKNTMRRKKRSIGLWCHHFVHLKKKKRNQSLSCQHI